MKNSQNLLYSRDQNDECYTPEYGVKPLLEFVNPQHTIWCPCDTAESAFVRLLTAHGCKVIHSHIDSGQDFLTHKPDFEFDAIITNPPFKGKRLFVERAISFGKPFALLLPATWLNDRAPILLMKKMKLQTLFLDKRIEYKQADATRKRGKVTFMSFYLCYNMFPNQICVGEIDKG